VYVCMYVRFRVGARPMAGVWKCKRVYVCLYVCVRKRVGVYAYLCVHVSLRVCV